MPIALVRPATTQDGPLIRALLERNGLPISDLDVARPEFVTACADGQIVGTGALQRFGSMALLRSVAVDLPLRGAGVGGLIVWELERLARARQLTELVLLTQTAKSFFEAQGYRVIDRKDAPAAVHDSEEFRSLCPASAACMAKTLA
jgi:amino-acid N-acetyltransferase